MKIENIGVVFIIVFGIIIINKFIEMILKRFGKM
jgi:hypothetical protein